MWKSFFFFVPAAFVAAQSATTTQQPCAIVSSRLNRATVVPAVEAYNCLNSVPVNTQGNQQLIDQLKQVWQFQSEYLWLKNPGSDWEYGALDIAGELDKIKSNLGSFSSEYAVQLAIQNITIRTGNFHFNYAPDILQVFRFRRQFNVGSVATNGSSLPKLYVHDDIKALAANRGRVSDISSINNQNPYDYLKSTFWSQYVDSDGQMNNMFAKGDTDHPGAFASQRKYDGNSTDVKWSNGSAASIINIATTQLDFSRVTDGRSFFQVFCTGALSSASAASASVKSLNVIAPRAPGPVPVIPIDDYHVRNKRQVIPSSSYPTAVAAAKSGVVAGYFLTGSGYSDVAVLKIISFANPDSENVEEGDFGNEFQATVKSFLARCISQNKKKLIIDLRENGGGSTNLLIDTFMQLFPDQDPYSAQRYRATDAFIKIGDAANEIYKSADLTRKYRTATGETIQDTSIFRYWAWWHFRKPDGTNWASWDDFNGPLSLNNDKFTATMRYNYSSADRVSVLPDGFNFVNGSRQTAFEASNVIMYTDALCGSSCASFHEELKNIAGVKAVTVGGRPQNAPIQTVTGSKGGEVIPLYTFSQYAGITLNVTKQLGLSSVKASDGTLSALANLPQIALRVGDAASRAQSQDQIRKGDKSATPLQFVYEAADCRIFYTPATYADPDLAWKQAWDAYLDTSKCVQGSTGHKSSISGGYTPYGSATIKAEDQPAGSSSSSSGTSGGSSGKSGAPAGNKASALVVALAAAVVAAAMV